MKRIIQILILSCIFFSMLVPNFVYAAVEGTTNEWQDILLSEKEFEEILSKNPNNEIVANSSDLIIKSSIGVAKDGNTLLIAGQTRCVSGVKKCGFSIVTIQRKKASSSTWTTYATYKDLYADRIIYNLSKQIKVTSGYQYRVTCTHYAKKSLLSVQKLNKTSNTVTF